MQEQIIRRARSAARKVAETVAEVEAKRLDTSETTEAAECCLAEIDEALAESEACCTEAAEVLKPKTWREMTDQELIDAGDLDFWTYWEESLAEQYGQDPDNHNSYYNMGYDQRTAALDEFHGRRDRYDQAYERIMGVSNHRDCGCGC